VTLIDPYYPESDDVVRRTRLLSGYDGSTELAEVGNQPVCSFSLQLLAAAKRVEPEQCLAELSAAGLTGAATEYHVINYSNNYRHSYQQHLPPGERFVDTFTSLRAGELLDQGQSHSAVAGLQAQIAKAIQDSTIVLVGATYDDSNSADWFRTSLSWKETISGVVVHANILNWLLRRSFISEPGRLLTFFMTLGLIMLSWLVIHFMEFKKAVLLLVLVFLTYGMATFILFARWEIWLPLIWPLRMAIYFLLLLGVLAGALSSQWKKKLQWLMPYASSSFLRRKRR
jgi:CHASE2 domain-containing sensor protein